MGIFDMFRRKSPIDPGLKQTVEDYKRNMAEGAEEATKSVEAIFGGLSDRDVSLLMAAAAGLIHVPSHLASRLDRYLMRKAHLRRAEAEAEQYFGTGVDALDAALDLLQRQPSWPDFLASVREEKGVRTAGDVGRWSIHGKRIAPYVWDCGFVFQTPEAAEQDGPVSVWSWRVDLRQGTSQPI